MRALIDGHPKWGVVRRALVDARPARTVFLVALLRFPPNSPFAFTNLVLAATGVRFWTMAIGSIRCAASVELFTMVGAYGR